MEADTMDIEGIKSDILTVWVAFIDSIVRFWNNRFNRNDGEIIYLREQIALLQQEKKGLLELLIHPTVAEPAEIEPEEFKPIGQARIPWHQKRRQLEMDSRQRAIKVAQEAEANTGVPLKAERTQTTSEIEAELGIE